jgi:hypothetical protein
VKGIPQHWSPVTDILQRENERLVALVNKACDLAESKDRALNAIIPTCPLSWRDPVVQEIRRQASLNQ